MTNKEYILLGLGGIIFIIGLVYVAGGINPNPNLYSAEFSYIAYNELLSWDQARLYELSVGSFRKQGWFSLYNPPLLFIWQDYKIYITVECNGTQVYYVEDFAKHVRQGTGVERQVTIKNLPAGASCKLTARMFRVAGDVFETEETTRFDVPLV